MFFFFALAGALYFLARAPFGQFDSLGQAREQAHIAASGGKRELLEQTTDNKHIGLFRLIYKLINCFNFPKNVLWLKI